MGNRHHKLLLILLCCASGLAPAQSTSTPAAAAEAEMTTQPSADVAPAPAGLPPSSGESALMQHFDAQQLGAEYIALDADGGPFLARYEAATEGPAHSALLVLADHGQLISDAPIVDALLQELPVNGWAVIAPQLPRFERDADFANYADAYSSAENRIMQTCVHLQSQGITTLVVLGLQGGASYAHRFLTELKAPLKVSGLAALGRWHGKVVDIKLPLLEVIGEIDSAAQAAARARSKSARRERLAHRMITMPGVDRDFSNVDAEVARLIRGWIKSSLKAGSPPQGS